MNKQAESIKNEFKQLHQDKAGVYMIRLNYAGVIVVNSEKAIDLPTEYKGIPVSVVVEPMMKTF